MLHRPVPPVDRHARFRRRRRDGRAVDLVELGGEEREFLIRTHWLLEGEACDRDAVGAGITRMLADAARR